MKLSCRHRGMGYICTRRKGHKGDHIARGTRGQIIQAWGRNEPELDENEKPLDSASVQV